LLRGLSRIHTDPHVIPKSVNCQQSADAYILTRTFSIPAKQQPTITKLCISSQMSSSGHPQGRPKAAESRQLLRHLRVWRLLSLRSQQLGSLHVARSWNRCCLRELGTLRLSSRSRRVRVVERCSLERLTETSLFSQIGIVQLNGLRGTKHR
jgi:hypothetical protein